MKHIYEAKIYHADTDCYGVVWHGTYLRLCELARCEFASKSSLPMEKIEEKGFCLLLTEANLKYKFPARVHDEIIIETSLEKLTPLRAMMSQKIINKKTGQSLVDVMVTFVCTDKNGNLCRKMPQEVFDMLKSLQD